MRIIRAIDGNAEAEVYPIPQNENGLQPRPYLIQNSNVPSNANDDIEAYDWGTNEEFFGADGQESFKDEFSFAIGRGGVRNAIKRRQVRRDKKLDSTIKARTSKADARMIKAKAKDTLAKSQVLAAKALSKSEPAPVLDNTIITPATEVKKSNTGLYVGLGVGAVLLIITGIIVVKKMKAKKG